MFDMLKHQGAAQMVGAICVCITLIAAIPVCLIVVGADSILHAADTEMEELLQKADDLYREAVSSPDAESEILFRQAASVYLRIIREHGVKNGYLYYNTGNCHLRNRELGLAIYYYRKASNIIPQFDDLRSNTAAAMAMRIDKVHQGQMTSIWRTLFFWHFFMANSAKTILFFVFYLLFWTAVIARIYLKKPVLKVISLLSLLFSVVFFSSLAAVEITERFSRDGVLVAESFEARSGPGESYDPAFTRPLNDGCEFEMIERDGGWMQVELSSGDRCWIRDDPAIAKLVRE